MSPSAEFKADQIEASVKLSWRMQAQRALKNATPPSFLPPQISYELPSNWAKLVAVRNLSYSTGDSGVKEDNWIVNTSGKHSLLTFRPTLPPKCIDCTSCSGLG
jgi:hypothetical protein